MRIRKWKLIDLETGGWDGLFYNTLEVAAAEAKQRGGGSERKLVRIRRDEYKYGEFLICRQ